MRYFNSIYILLLAYIITAIIFWGYALHQQSIRIYKQEVLTLNAQIDPTLYPLQYNLKQAELEQNLGKRTRQYLAEGTTFLVVIIIGAGVVYNSFRRRIELGRQQNNFMLSVTHELKSPIAAMKLNMQTMERHKLDEQNRGNLIGRCITEADRLNELCNKILYASQIEGRQFKVAKEKLHLHELLQDIVAEYSLRYPNRITAHIADEAFVMGDRSMLLLVCSNLLENAIKYTPAASPITVLMHLKAPNVSIEIADLGAGIPEKEKKKVFLKFYRIGSEESRTAKGTGLGLYLVSKIVHQHKGSIQIKDNKPQGSIFEVLLPLK